ncbi:MAG: TlpA family protein disulfide reductase [Terriglobia bacterium]
MGKWIAIPLGIGIVVLVAFLSLAWIRGKRPLETGDRAPRVALPALNSVSFPIHTGSGRVVIVNFWASWCPPCVEETPSLEKFAARMKPLGVRVVGVSVDQDLSQLTNFIASYRLTYPILRDPNQALAARWGTYKFPETYIFDRDGRLADKVIGATDWDSPSMIQFVTALVDWNKAGAPQQAAAASNW